MKIVIVGAGIAGLAVGWELAKAGAEVEILDRGLAGHGATWASGGMLAPGAELGAEETPLARFAHESRKAWNDFARTLREASGADIGFREDGAFLVAANEARARDLSSVATATGATMVESRVAGRSGGSATSAEGRLATCSAFSSARRMRPQE